MKILSRHIISRLVVTGVLFLGIISIANGQAQLPDFGNAGDSLITPEKERKIGQGALQQFRAYELVLDDPVLDNYLSSLAFRLVENSESPETKFKFFLLHDQSVNAFAMPGGFIGVHAGLILATETESELAGVLAHEIAHVTQRHLVRRVDSTRRIVLPIAAAMAAALALGSGQSDAAPAAIMSGISLLQQAQINFTREHEHEADRIGITDMARSGFDPQGVASFFEKMERISRNYGQSPPEYLRSHPVSAVRVAEARSRAEKMTAAESTRLSSYDIIKERVRVLSDPDNAHAMEFYALQKSAQAPIKTKAAIYGSALAASRSGHIVSAIDQLNKALQQYPDDYFFKLALAETLTSDGQLASSLTLLRDMSRNYPGNYPVEALRAETLLQSRKSSSWRKARSIIRKQITKRPLEPGLYQALARSEDRLGNHVAAIEATAENYHLAGRTQEAIRLLRGLLKGDELGYYESARIEARAAHFHSELSEKERKKFDKTEKSRKRGDPLETEISSADRFQAHNARSIGA